MCVRRYQHMHCIRMDMDNIIQNFTWILTWIHINMNNMIGIDYMKVITLIPCIYFSQK